MRSPENRADNSIEINETEISDGMRGLRDQNSPEISNHFSIWGCVRAGSVEYVDPSQRSKIFQKI